MLRRWAVIGAFRFSVVPLFRREAIPSAVRYCTVLYLLCVYLSFFFFLPWASTLGNFDSIVPVYVIRVKSYVDSFLDPTCAPVRVLINKLYFFSNWIVAGLLGMLRNGGGLKTSDSNFTVVPLDPSLHCSQFRRCKLYHSHGVSCNRATLLGRSGRVLRSYQVRPKCGVGLEHGLYTLLIPEIFIRREINWVHVKVIQRRFLQTLPRCQRLFLRSFRSCSTPGISSAETGDGRSCFGRSRSMLRRLRRPTSRRKKCQERGFQPRSSKSLQMSREVTRVGRGGRGGIRRLFEEKPYDLEIKMYAAIYTTFSCNCFG